LTIDGEVIVNIGDFARLGRVSPRMLRHYDALGLLGPDRVDPATGYRAYTVGQLARLHRILALRDLGFTLDSIGAVLDDEPSLEQLQGMLRIRRAQIEESLAEEQARLRRVEARLRCLEGSVTVDVVVKQSEPLRIAEMAGTAPGFGPANIGPVFARLVPELLGVLDRAGVKPGMLVGWYEELDDGDVIAHVGFDIADQPFDTDTGGDVSVADLPVIDVASVVHRGALDGIEGVYLALVQWIVDSGYELAGRSRELYHASHGPDSPDTVTELQMPIDVGSRP
jgi:DNA-binding transcriptional MerR regulator